MYVGKLHKFDISINNVYVMNEYAAFSCGWPFLQKSF